MTYANGDVYVGEWTNDFRHGKGKHTLVSGEVYDGQWVNNFRHGKGKITFANQNVYEGDFVLGIQHGKGKETLADGSSLGRYVFGSEISYNKPPPRLPGLGC